MNIKYMYSCNVLLTHMLYAYQLKWSWLVLYLWAPWPSVDWWNENKMNEMPCKRQKSMRTLHSTPSHRSIGLNRSSSCLWHPSIFITHTDGYILISDAHTAFPPPSPMADTQSKWHEQRGKLSGPSSQVASKSQWMSRHASLTLLLLTKLLLPLLVMAFGWMLLFGKVTCGRIVTEVTWWPGPWPCLDEGKVGAAAKEISGLVL
jgi:hypothetical protein